MKSIYLTCALTAVVYAACATITPHMNNIAELQGTWTCVAAIIAGKPLPKETAALLRLTLTRDRYKTEKGTDVLFDSTYTTDPSKNPREINMIGTEGDLKGKEAQGIYSLEKDTLRICYTMPGDGRPERFESPAGSKAYLVIWQREQK